MSTMPFLRQVNCERSGYMNPQLIDYKSTADVMLLSVKKNTACRKNVDLCGTRVEQAARTDPSAAVEQRRLRMCG